MNDGIDFIDLMSRESHLNEYVEFVLLMLRGHPEITEDFIKYIETLLRMGIVIQLANLKIVSMSKEFNDQT